MDELSPENSPSPESLPSMSASASPGPKKKASKDKSKSKTGQAKRAKSGCYTCRIRRKKCDERPNESGSCETCVRLRLQCLGFGAKRPEWLRESRNVVDLRDKIKTFLAAQGMIKGHSTAPAPRTIPPPTGSPVDTDPSATSPTTDPAIPELLNLIEEQTHKPKSGSPTPMALDGPSKRRTPNSSPPTPTLSVGSQDGPPYRKLGVTTSAIRESGSPSDPSIDPSLTNGYEAAPKQSNGNGYRFSRHSRYPSSHSTNSPFDISSTSSTISPNSSTLPRSLSDDFFSPAPALHSNLSPSYNYQVGYDDPDTLMDEGTYRQADSEAAAMLLSVAQQQQSSTGPQLFLAQQNSGYPPVDNNSYSYGNVGHMLYGPSLAPQAQTWYLDHYKSHIIPIQFLLADRSRVHDIIANVLNSSDFSMTSTSMVDTSTVAAELLASISFQRGYNPNVPSRFLLENSETAAKFQDLAQMVIGRSSGEVSIKDAVAALNVISSILFDGGISHSSSYLNPYGGGSETSVHFEPWIELLFRFSQSILKNSMYGLNARDALLHCREEQRFIIKASIWFDAISSITAQRKPIFREFINDLYNPHAGRIQELPGPDYARSTSFSSPSSAYPSPSSTGSPRPLPHIPRSNRSPPTSFQTHNPVTFTQAGINGYTNQSLLFQQQPPRTHYSGADSYGSPTSVDGYDPEDATSPLDLMGCTSTTLFVLSETIALSHRKEMHRETLMTKDLVERGEYLESILLEDEQNQSASHSFGSGYNSEKVEARRLASTAFRAAAILFVRTVVNDSYAYNEGIRDGVARVMKTLHEIEEAQVSSITSVPAYNNNGYSTSSQRTKAAISLPISRSLYFPIFLAGVLTTRVEDRNYISNLLASPSSLPGSSSPTMHVGNASSVKRLIEQIWHENSHCYRVKGPACPVKWQDTLCNAGVLLI